MDKGAVPSFLLPKKTPANRGSKGNSQRDRYANCRSHPCKECHVYSVMKTRLIKTSVIKTSEVKNFGRAVDALRHL